jgi:peptide/nickel transport system substrate-binding protein
MDSGWLNDETLELTEKLIAFYERLGLNRRQFLKMLGTGVAAGMCAPFVEACSPSPALPAASQSPQPGGPVTPKVLVYASGQDISNLDPHVGHDYSIANTQRSVYDALLDYRGNPPKLEPNLAREWSVSPDARVWTLKLATNAKFHDGSPVKAQDVVYSFQRLIRKKKGPAWMFITIMDENSAKAIDDYTVQVTLTKPYAPFEAILPWLFVVNPKVVKANEQGGDEGEAWLKDHEAGSGPFVIKRWEIGNLYEFEAVPDYWAGWPKEGRLAGYVWRIIRESSSQRLAIQKGDVHIADTLSAEDIQALRGDPNILINDERSFSYFAIKLNNQRGPTSDKQVRKAIAYAMDYDAVVKAQAGRTYLLKGFLPPNLEPWYRGDIWPFKTDIDRARAELAKSRYPNGGFELEYVYVTGLAIEEKIGLILLDQLSKLNIKVNMKAMVWPDMVARAKDPATAPDMMAVYSGTAFADPDNWLWQAFHSSQAGFWAAASHYKNPEVDRLLEEGRATTDPKRRKEIYDRVQEILVEDVPEIPVMSDIANIARRKNVGGWVYTPIMGAVYFKRLYLTS